MFGSDLLLKLLSRCNYKIIKLEFKKTLRSKNLLDNKIIFFINCFKHYIDCKFGKRLFRV